MEGVFINCQRPDASALVRHVLLAADAAFAHLLTAYLVALYFVMMSHTIYRHTNDFAGNTDDFYIEGGGGRRSFSVPAGPVHVPLTGTP